MRTPRALVLAVALLAMAGAAWAQPPVWVVRDKDSELLIFGSIHMLPPDLDWRPPALTRALSEADDVWFEIAQDPRTQARVGELAGASGRLPTGQSLFKLLPPKDSARLLKVARDYGVDPAALDGLKPWLAEIAIAAGVYRKAGAGLSDGVEAALAGRAPPERQRALETPEQQMALFSGGSMADQIASLRQTLDEVDDDPAAFKDLVEAWMAADVGRIETEAVGPLRKAAPGLYRRLVTERNARWAQLLNTRLKGSGHTVVVVGVGHLVGPGSLPQRLRALGYSVTGP